MRIEQGVAPTNSVEIAYEDMGSVDDPAVLLIMGLSAQLTLWPMDFCTRLVDAGYRVIRIDNRDIGLSTKMTGQKVRGSQILRLIRHEFGMSSDVPYTITDMAADAVGVLDHLDIDSVHVVGASMGGMITQVFAGRYPERTKSVGILFSSTNEPFLPPPDPRALLPLIGGVGKDATKDEIIAHSAKTLAAIGSPGYRTPPEEQLEIAQVMYERNYNPSGVVRQMAAITGTGSLRPYARKITAPTTVIHGTADKLVRPSGGKAIARAVPDAELTLIDGMAHDLPAALLDRISGIILANFARAKAA
ncbi:Alpha/beta hydrolase fold protein [Rhodococcus sp. AW25M09]|uniref:alpha/beta fold hydrolase n=1 Tax=Rhodococcus sp. AW25M09 TaxID=1268303 RepID=UPI0002AC1297|nr:alpha/beta hydrolase [Rhodococcus sp. AW25M09]CCQ15218.1 Alpha/beta hydrolase fold protein [Rhodococcus sp. AW25M09]